MGVGVYIVNGIRWKQERTIFDGLAPDALISHELIEAWEQTISALDEEIAHLVKARGAYVRLIIEGRRRLRDQSVVSQPVNE